MVYVMMFIVSNYLKKQKLFIMQADLKLTHFVSFCHCDVSLHVVSAKPDLTDGSLFWKNITQQLNVSPHSLQFSHHQILTSAYIHLLSLCVL